MLHFGKFLPTVAEQRRVSAVRQSVALCLDLWHYTVTTSTGQRVWRHLTCAPLISPKHCTIAVITTPTATAGYMGSTGLSVETGTVEPSKVLTNTRVAMNSASMARQNWRLRSSFGREDEGEGPLSLSECMLILLIGHRESFHKASEKADDEILWSTWSALTDSSKLITLCSDSTNESSTVTQ